MWTSDLQAAEVSDDEALCADTAHRIILYALIS